MSGILWDKGDRQCAAAVGWVGARLALVARHDPAVHWADMTDGVSREARLQELRPFVVQARVMQGWTFAYEAVPLGPPAPWDYEGRARELARDAASVLDMGTGGGEVFERILAGQRGQVAATEGWAPNVPVAAQRLRRLGVSMVHALNLTLPFAAESFELLLDRHEELSPADVARVLCKGGRLLTQQVHPEYYHELRDFFPRMTIFEPHDVTYPAGLAAAGMVVDMMRQHSAPGGLSPAGPPGLLLSGGPVDHSRL